MEGGPDFGALFRSLPDRYLVLDPSLRIVAVTDAYAEATMRAPAELVGLHIFEAFPDNPDDPETTGERNLRASIDRVRRTGQPDAMAVQKYDIPRSESDGGGFQERYWSPRNYPLLDDEGKLAYILHRAEDVTALVRGQDDVAAQTREVAEANRSLKEANGELALMAAIVQTMAEAVALVRASDGVIVYTNPRWDALLGYQPGELEGRPVAVVNAPTERSPEETAAEIIAALEDQATWNGEVANLRKDGSVIWCEANVSTLDHPLHGTVWVSVHTDITARKRAEEELLRSNAELQEFAYVASHDLSEPLRTVAGFAALLERRYGETLEEDGRSHLRHIGEALARMQRLLDDLLSYAKAGGELAQAPVVLDGVVDELRESLAARIAETGATIDAEPLPVVMGDRVRLVQVFQNILANAMKFSGDDPPRIRISAAQEDDLWAISIADDGLGMRQDQAVSIFGMFQRVHAGEGEGTGLGLAICKRIVELHGGTIRVDSAPGRGSTFTFTLPGARPG